MAICFFCGAEVTPSSQKNPVHTDILDSWRISCASSVSAALGLPQTPSIQLTMTRQAKYCQDCLGLMRDIDFFTRSIQRFQNGLSAKTAILRRKIQKLSSKRLANASKNTVPGSRKIILRTRIESKAKEVQNTGNTSNSVIRKHPPPLAPSQFQSGCINRPGAVVNSRAAKESKPVRKKLPVILKLARAKKKEPETRKKVTNPVTGSLVTVKQEVVDIADSSSDGEEMGNSNSALNPPGSEHCLKNEEDESFILPGDISDSEKSVVSEIKAEKDVSETPEPSRPECVTVEPRKRSRLVRPLPKKPCPLAHNGCSFRYIRNDHLSAHMRKAHKVESKRIHNGKHWQWQLQCRFCEKQFLSESSHVEHERQHMGEGDWAAKCEGCSRILCSRSALVKHAPVCPAKSLAQACPQPQCHFRYGQEDELNNHIRKVHEGDPKPYHCTYPPCQKKFRFQHEYSIHLKWHTGQGLLPCPHCQAPFNSKYSLKIHNKRCTAERPKPPNSKARTDREHPPSQCTHANCDYIGDETEMVGHVRTAHLGEPSPFFCSICEKDFKSVRSLKHHEKLHVLRRGDPGHNCQFCPKVCWTRGAVKLHEKRRHVLELRHNLKFVCPACSKHFGTTAELHAHAGLHEAAAQPFACVLCDLVPHNSMDLKAHVRHAHEDGFPQCPKCLKRWKDFDSHARRCKGPGRTTPNLQCPACPFIGPSLLKLTMHRLEEHGGNFVCQECGKQFLVEPSLKLHMRVHRRELRYACSLCPRRFITGTVLKWHEERHATENSSFCPKCNKGYKLKINMLAHLKRQCKLNPDRPPRLTRSKKETTSIADDYIPCS